MNTNAFVMSLLPKPPACLPALTGSVRIDHLLGPHHSSCWQEYCLHFQPSQSLSSERSSDFLKVTQHVGWKSVLNQSLVIFPPHPDCFPWEAGWVGLGAGRKK